MRNGVTSSGDAVQCFGQIFGDGRCIVAIGNELDRPIDNLRKLGQQLGCNLCGKTSERRFQVIQLVVELIRSVRGVLRNDDAKLLRPVAEGLEAIGTLVKELDQVRTGLAEQLHRHSRFLRAIRKLLERIGDLRNKRREVGQVIP